jgi:tRNA threonylcarbamoyladenosine biosynthesis protein TsaE
MLLAAPEETLGLGRRVATHLEPGDLVFLSGPLGAGKTLLAGAIAHGLGVAEDVPITSPTFALVQEYAARACTLLHVDLYRLRDGARSLGDEVARLGLRERRLDGAVVLVEWGDGSDAAWGSEPDLTVTLSVDGPMRRTAMLSGPRANAITSA